MSNTQMSVSRIKPWETHQWLLFKHYAKRLPIITDAFGLFCNKELRGVVTYGHPPTPHLCRGICGEDYAPFVRELNRLCLQSNDKNEASILIGRSLKLLEKPRIVVSYADAGFGHVGYIYQATNFIYTGLSAKRKDPLEFDTTGGKHARHSRGKWGKDLKDRPRKHRYVFFVGDKRQKKKMRESLNYKVFPYPKGPTRRYDAGSKVETQIHLFEGQSNERI